MFGDTLLESSSTARRRKRWPMATAFTVEAIVAAIIVIVPLLSTGVIPVSARVPVYTPINRVEVERIEEVPADRSNPSGSATSTPTSTVVTLGGGTRKICLTCALVDSKGDGPIPYTPYVGSDSLPIDLLGRNRGSGVKPGGPKRIISVLSEAQLLNRVEPVYPRIAVLSGIQGQVKLHAIIARNGSIESLNVISGHPLLIRAATDAVSQWRYRPYILNGEAVEVETFITVNFKKDGK